MSVPKIRRSTLRIAILLFTGQLTQTKLKIPWNEIIQGLSADAGASASDFDKNFGAGPGVPRKTESSLTLALISLSPRKLSQRQSPVLKYASEYGTFFKLLMPSWHKRLFKHLENLANNFKCYQGVGRWSGGISKSVNGIEQDIWKKV